MVHYEKYQFIGESHPLKGLRYARPVIRETLDTEVLAKHMINHNTPYSAGLVRGVLVDTTAHTKEFIPDDKNVKLDDPVILSMGIVSKKGAISAAEFTLVNSVRGLKLRTHAIGELNSTQTNLEGQLKEVFKYNAGNGSGNGGSTPGGDDKEEEDPLE